MAEGGDPLLQLALPCARMLTMSPDMTHTLVNALPDGMEAQAMVAALVSGMVRHPLPAEHEEKALLLLLGLYGAYYEQELAWERAVRPTLRRERVQLRSMQAARTLMTGVCGDVAHREPGIVYTRVVVQCGRWT